MLKKNQDNDFNDNKLTNIDSITMNRNPTSENEVTNKKYIDDELDKNTILRFNQTLQNYLEVSVGNNIYIYNLTKYDRIQITDTTIINYPITGGYLLQNWIINCNNKNNNGKIQNFIRSTKKTVHHLTPELKAYHQLGMFLCIQKQALTIMGKMCL